jgi:hypothetical protein
MAAELKGYLRRMRDMLNEPLQADPTPGRAPCCH